MYIKTKYIVKIQQKHIQIQSNQVNLPVNLEVYGLPIRHKWGKGG